MTERLLFCSALSGALYYFLRRVTDALTPALDELGLLLQGRIERLRR